MIIGVDIRPLSGGKKSGVEEYTLNLLLNLLKIDQKNNYKLFYNSFGKAEDDILCKFKSYPNVEICQFRYPNKFFNLSCRFLGRPYIDQLIKPIDVFFMPNVLFSALSPKCKRVVTFHDLSYLIYPEFYSFKRRWWHRVINTKKLAQEADRVIAVSESTKRDLIKYFSVPEEKIKVIHSGLEKSDDVSVAELEKAKKEYDLPDEYILHLGVIEPRKNLIGIVSAFERFKKTTNLPHKLVIAGSPGWLHSKIHDRINQSTVAEDIIVLGFVDDKLKPALYRLADLFLFPSFYEGFGFPALEAQRHGTPVITSSVSSLPEVCGASALYVDPYNVSKLAVTMKEVLTNKELRGSLAEQGCQQADKFSWQKAASKTLQVFSELN